MSTTNLYTLPINAMIIDDETSLCVFDEYNNLKADYDLTTGLRLLLDGESLTVYIHNKDLVPGAWVLFVGLMTAEFTKESDTVQGFTEGTPVPRDYNSESPWDSRQNFTGVTLAERERRLSICALCPLLDTASMTCTVSNKLVTNVTTIDNQYCPEDKWGNKQQVMDEAFQLALDKGEIALPTPISVEKEDQAQFEAELNSYLEGL